MSMMTSIENLQIRSAKVEDADGISNLLVQLGYETSTSKISRLLSSASSGGDQVWVATSEVSLLAVIAVICFNYFPTAEKICRITAIVVDKEFRGQGIGTQLIEYAKEHAISERCSALELTTSEKRRGAHAYYESIGFERDSYKYVQRLTYDI